MFPVLPILGGMCLGILYGLAFVRQQGRAFLSLPEHSQSRFFLLMSTITHGARLAIPIVLCFYLLRLPIFHSILTVMVFLIAFWFIIIQKIVMYEKS